MLTFTVFSGFVHKITGSAIGQKTADQVSELISLRTATISDGLRLKMVLLHLERSFPQRIRHSFQRSVHIWQSYKALFESMSLFSVFSCLPLYWYIPMTNKNCFSFFLDYDVLWPSKRAEHLWSATFMYQLNRNINITDIAGAPVTALAWKWV